MPLCLSIGSLDGMKCLKRTELEKYINLNQNKLLENGFDFKYEYNKLIEYANIATKIRIWSSHLDCDDYCLLLYICYLLKEKNISVIYTEELDWEATTLGCITEKELKILEQKEHLNDGLLEFQENYFQTIQFKVKKMMKNKLGYLYDNYFMDVYHHDEITNRHQIQLEALIQIMIMVVLLFSIFIFAADYICGSINFCHEN